MATHNEIGKLGEELAVQYFSQMGYLILHKNWRFKHWEVDLIAERQGKLHFIEVKTKSSDKNGFPEEMVSISKFQNILNASEVYLSFFPQWERIQFDVLAVTLHPSISYFLIEDIYI